MADPLPAWLSRYRRHERAWDVAFWAAVLGTELVFNTLVSWIDLRRGWPAQPLWQPAVWELTSTAVVAALIPAVVAWERRHPLRLDTLPGALGWHLLGSIGFTAVHVPAMVLLRQGAYALAGQAYRPGSWLTMAAYEYLKDVRTYLLVLVAVLGWRLWLLRVQGEARVLDPPEPPAGQAPAAPARPERFLVRKLRKEFLVPAAEIEWIQAQGNYLGLRVHGHDYLLRSTLGEFLAQLDPARFVRVHRSWVVNLDRVAEIVPLDAGDARLTMKDGSAVPCSRRYRDALGG